MNKNILNKILIPASVVGVVSIAFLTKGSLNQQNSFYDKESKNNKIMTDVMSKSFNNFLSKSYINSLEDSLYDLDKNDKYLSLDESNRLSDKISETFNVSGESLGKVKDKNAYTSLCDEFKKNNLNINNLKIANNGDVIYIIKRGDTLTDISRLFGYSVDKLANYNEIRDVNLIYANSSLRLPN